MLKRSLEFDMHAYEKKHGNIARFAHFSLSFSCCHSECYLELFAFAFERFAGAPMILASNTYCRILLVRISYQGAVRDPICTSLVMDLVLVLVLSTAFATASDNTGFKAR